MFPGSDARPSFDGTQEDNHHGGGTRRTIGDG